MGRLALMELGGGEPGSLSLKILGLEPRDLVDRGGFGVVGIENSDSPSGLNSSLVGESLQNEDRVLEGSEFAVLARPPV